MCTIACTILFSHYPYLTSIEIILYRTGLAINSNPAEYAARLLESETEKSSWMTLLPIFYYNETLFPGSRLDLHLFEPRYRVMMQRVVNSTRSFAYVPNFNQYRANVGDVALVAVLEEVEFMADGRCMLQAKLSSRMVITEHYGNCVTTINDIQSLFIQFVTSSTYIIRTNINDNVIEFP
jgi:hypothetical protein